MQRYLSAEEPRSILEGFLDGSLLDGYVYLMVGGTNRDRSMLASFSACSLSRKRRALLFSLSPATLRVAGAGCSKLSVLDASTIREEGVTVVAEKLMDTLSSGGAVYIDSLDLFSSMLSNDREYKSLMYSLQRMARLGSGSLAVFSSELGLEASFSDVIVKLSYVSLADRSFRVLHVVSPSSPFWRTKFLLAFSPKPYLPEPLVARRDVRLELPGELREAISNVCSGTRVEVEVDSGVPGFLVGSIVAALKAAVSSPALYAENAGEANDRSVLLVSGSADAERVRVTCRDCGDKPMLADCRAVFTVISGVPVFFFSHPWSPPYVLSLDEETGRVSLKEFY